MPVEFQIIAARGVVYIKHSGYAAIAESSASFREYMAHPDAAPGQIHLVDYSEVTDYERDWLKIMQLQADLTLTVPDGAPQILLILFAPTALAQEVAMLVCKSWDGSNKVLPRVVESESAALALAGQTETRFADLLAESNTAR